MSEVEVKVKVKAIRKSRSHKYMTTEQVIEKQAYQKAYVLKNKKHLSEYNAIYYDNRKDEMKKYYIDNLAKIKARLQTKVECPCGRTIMKRSLKQHLSTKRHLKKIKVGK